ncbi:signal-induced proliferation-associated 1-like protein 1 isoform X1 [Hydra vulgaris]|uniref:signal-induced proliferation-associated 1-like protein 1 isoform X1 n=1 Tax=Hydra vulgaris TaxID=6087 RepID=UPI0006413021|nr:signal-induced proliferation-associated 1-like protein 1 isoform X2 [Hydra vulgaris]
MSMINSFDIICHICQEPIVEVNQCFYFSPKRNQYICHKHCFKCASCKQILFGKVYFLSPRKKFYCHLHHDNESPNVHENFFRELGIFKQVALMKIEGHGRGKEISFTSQANNDFLKCQCTGGELLLINDGYWIECVLEECPFYCFYRTYNRTNFEIPYWKLSTNHSDGYFQIDFFEEELFELCFADDDHTNYYCVDESIGPIVLSMKHGFISGKSCYRVLLRSSSHIIESVVPLSCFCLYKYDEQPMLDLVRKGLILTSGFTKMVNPESPAKLKSLDKVMLKDELKVGLIFVKEGQRLEEEFFTNTEHSKEFDDFLGFLGDRVKLGGFKGYSGGLDTKHSLTGEYSIYKEWRNYKVMFHVATLLPMDEHDDLKLQRKRHVGNDIVCLVFLEPGAKFEPASVRSNFLHIFIAVQPHYINDKIFYRVSVASRKTVLPFGPPIPFSQLFEKNEFFHDWLFAKMINGERSSYRSLKFFTMQERTRRQLLDEIVYEQQCKETEKSPRGPFQRLWFSRASSLRSQQVSVNGSLTHSSSMGDAESSMRADAVRGNSLSQVSYNGINQFSDVFFLVGDNNDVVLPAVGAILAARSRVFYELLYCDHMTISRSNSMLYSSSTQSSVPANVRKRWSDFWKKAYTLNQYVSSNKKSSNIQNSDVPFIKEFSITEFEPYEFQALLEFIHNGSCFIHKDILIGVACAAECYGVRELMQLCVDCCSELINPYNACLLFSSVRQFVLRYNVAKLLEKKISEFIVVNADKIFDSFDMASLSEDCLLQVLSLNLKMSETKKFKLIRSWYNRVCALGLEDEILKENLISFINFIKFSDDELKQVALSGFLTKSSSNVNYVEEI